MKKMPIILVGSLIFVIFFAKYIPVHAKSFLYSISLTIQSVLIFLVPGIISVFIFRSMVVMEGNALKFVFFFVVLIYVSSFVAAFISFNLSFYSQTNLNLVGDIGNMRQASLEPLWSFNIPQIISNKMALLLGILAGLSANYALKNGVAKDIAEKTFVFAMRSMDRFFTPIVPIFILGFLLKLEQDNMFGTIVKNHFHVVRNAMIFGVLYILMVYLISSRFNLKRIRVNISNMLPAAITAFLSMSSTAALPYIIKGVGKNIGGDSKLITSLVPLVTNMHLLGDCFLMPACIYIVLQLFGYQTTYIEFSLFLTYFVLMKFTALTIPGGGVLVMMPILQSQLGFTPEMLSLITAIYFLVDPFLALLNVLGNGALCLVLSKLLQKFSLKKDGLKAAVKL